MAHASPIPHFTPLKLSAKLHPAQAIYWVEAMFRTLRERRQLMQLDGRALQDIGVSRAEAEGEWSRPFWDLPKDR
jgi:uncharacterized protein YjiS (DUF1127 family)